MTEPDEYPDPPLPDEDWPLPDARDGTARTTTDPREALAAWREELQAYAADVEARDRSERSFGRAVGVNAALDAVLALVEPVKKTDRETDDAVLHVQLDGAHHRAKACLEHSDHWRARAVAAEAKLREASEAPTTAGDVRGAVEGLDDGETFTLDALRDGLARRGQVAGRPPDPEALRAARGLSTACWSPLSPAEIQALAQKLTRMKASTPDCPMGEIVKGVVSRGVQAWAGWGADEPAAVPAEPAKALIDALLLPAKIWARSSDVETLERFGVPVVVDRDLPLNHWVLVYGDGSMDLVGPTVVTRMPPPPGAGEPAQPEDPNTNGTSR